MKISVIIPTYNEESFIIKCLDSLYHQTIGAHKYEILVVDGCSSDKTRELAETWKKNHKEINLKILDNPKRITPTAFNIGLKNAKGEFINLFGAHSIVGPNFLENVIETFENYPEIDACGGVVHTTYSEDNENSKLIAYIWQHPFGVGRGMRTPETVKEGYSNAVAKISYRKRIFNQLGLFDENFVRNQDNDMNYRLIKKGGKIWLNPEIQTTYFSRPTVKKMLKTAYYNSYFHSLFLKKHRMIPSLKYIVPGLFVMAFILFLLFGLLNKLGILALASLFLIHQFVALFSSISFWKHNKFGMLKLPLLFWGLHFSYGLGLLVGSLHFFVFKKKINQLNTR